jgi:hypothetical protein
VRSTPASGEIERLLKAAGPQLSTDLCEALQRRGLSKEAARQRVSRAHGQVRRLGGLTFPHSARFLYHQSDFGSRQYWEALVRDIGRASPAYSAAIDAMQARGGIVPAAHFPIICGSPLRQRGQISSDGVLTRLQSVGLVDAVDVARIGPCIALAAAGYFGYPPTSQLRARLLAERIILLAVKDWARKLGLVSYDKVSLRDDSESPPTVGTFAWDLGAPSYVTPLVRRAEAQKPKPGFVVCDVVAYEIGRGAVGSFLRKCRTARALPGLPAFLPMLVADRFTPEGLRLGKSNGVIMATPEILFGREVAAGLRALLEVLTEAANSAIERPEIVTELFNKLGHIEGAAANLRGALFELIVGHCVAKVDDGAIEIGKKVVDPSTGHSAEIDVLRIREHHEIWAYECKGHQPTASVSLADVDMWLRKRVSRIHAALARETRFQECEFHYEYWTCGTFAPDALAVLEDARRNTRRYTIGWKDGDAVREYVAKVRPKAIAEMLDQHFLRHPLAALG